MAQPVTKASGPHAERREAVPLRDVPTGTWPAYGSGFPDLDVLLGKGLVPGAAIVVGGEPGIGKSTLLLQIAGAVADSGKKVLYASGEESLPQIKSRAERVEALNVNLLALATNSLGDVMAAIDADPPALLVLDSVQTMISDHTYGLPGSVSQVRAVSNEITSHCKNAGTTVIMVGHVTKDGDLAGPRMLEHLVDTVISLEGDRRQMFRVLRVIKNRFGPNQELLLFRMAGKGMEIVEDASTFFLGTRDTTLSGTAVVMAIEGQRPFAVEIQALTTKTFLSVPRRTGLGFDVNRLYVLLAVLEKRLRINFAHTDIFAKVGGGMKLAEPGVDLAIIAAVLSSFYDIPLPERAVFWGEVDLNGQIRQVADHVMRMKQAQKLGYEPVFCSGDHKGAVKTVSDLQKFLFRK